jgi:hypothetical protein
MKTRILQIGGLGLLLAGVVAVTGSSNTPSGPVSTITPPPTRASDAVPDPLTYQPAPEIAQVINRPASASNEGKVVAIATLPVDLHLSPNLTEVTKLIQAGVAESVVRSFISNTSGAFSLGSDEIIYLNDLGVSGEVITAMMEHDQAWSSTVQSAPPPTPTIPAPAAESADNMTETAAGEYAPPNTVVVPQQPVTVNYFYDSLSPYGNWIEVEGYGRCWQPVIVVRQPAWRPYCDNGRWVYTDYGWYWVSDYSWGMTFHYGRWFQHPRRGWCWAPDTVWSPAWVSWRSSSDYCGWAPLPPATGWIPGVGFGYRNHGVGFSFDFGLAADCFTFVRYDRFRDRHVGRHAMPHQEAARIINQTTVVNNFIQGNNNTIINRGITPARVAAATGTQVTPVPVSHVAANRPGDGQGHRGRPSFDRPAGVQSVPGGWSRRSVGDTPHAPNGNAGNRDVPTPPVTATPPPNTNPGYPVQRQRLNNWRDSVHSPSPSRVQPDNTSFQTPVQLPAPSAPPAIVMPDRTTVPSTGTPTRSPREWPNRPNPRPNVDPSQSRSSPSSSAATAETTPVTTTTPATVSPQVEHRLFGSSRQPVVAARREAAAWPQTTIARPSVENIRVRPGVSSWQVPVVERPQFQSPPVVARPQILPQAPVVSAPQPPSRSPEVSSRTTRNDSQGDSTNNRGRRDDQNQPGPYRGRR